MMERVIYTEQQPHNTDEKSRWQRLFRPHYSRKDASLVMSPIIFGLPEIVKYRRVSLDPRREQAYNTLNRIERNALALLKQPRAWVTSWRLATMNNSILPQNKFQSNDDPQPDFPPKLIQRVDPLSYMLPMIAPDGSRCMVALTGDFAAWGACMSALVREGFAQAEPSAWAKGGAE